MEKQPYFVVYLDKQEGTHRIDADGYTVEYNADNHPVFVRFFKGDPDSEDGAQEVAMIPFYQIQMVLKKL
jgi:hypothetical protein